MRGEAPSNPELAEVTIDAAEYYQTDSRVTVAVNRWLPMFLALSLIVPTATGALDGQIEMVFFFSLGVLGVIAHLMLNPWTRPRNVAKSKAASERMIAEMPRPAVLPNAATGVA